MSPYLPYKLGKFLITSKAADLLYSNDLYAADFLKNHYQDLWGFANPISPDHPHFSLDSKNKRVNGKVQEEDGRLMTSHTITISGESKQIWVVTEESEGTTTVLLPSEY